MSLFDHFVMCFTDKREAYRELEVPGKRLEKYGLTLHMIDSRNQSLEDVNRPNDQVNGYTLQQLQQALTGNLESWYGWRNNIKSMFSNPTEQHVDYLFNEYLD